MITRRRPGDLKTFGAVGFRVQVVTGRLSNVS